MHVLFPHGVHHRLQRYVPAKVQHLKAVVFQNDPDDVLANVVHIALDGGKDDTPLAGAALALLGNGSFDLLKGALGGAGSLQQLRQEQGAFFVLGTHDVQSGDQGFVHHFQRLLFCQQGAGMGGGVTFQALFHRFHQGGVGAGKFCFGGTGGRHGLCSLCQRGAGGHAVGKALDVLCALLVPVGQHVVGVHRRHHLLTGGVHDGKVQPCVHGHGQKGGVQVGAAGQTKADVGHAQHGAHAQLLFAGFKRLYRGQHIFLLGAGGQGKAVDVDILPGNACCQRRFGDAAGNGHTVCGFGLDAFFVDGQTHDGGTVLLAQRQDGGKFFRLAVGGVDDGLAVVHPQTPRQRLHVGGVQLQGQTGHALQRLDHLLHQHRLVYAGCAYVHVQDLRTGLCLTDGLLQHIVHVAFPQCLLEALFAGGVDALAHHRDAVHRDRVHRGAQHRGHPVRGTPRGAACKGAVEQLDELRGGAAAAAGSKQVQLPVGLHLQGEQLRGDVVAAAVRPGQTGVGLDEHREVAGHGLGQSLCHGEDLFGSQRAVDAHGVCPQAPGGGGKAFHCAAGKGAPARFKAHAGQNGQAGVLLGSQQGGFQLVQVGVGLKKDQVCPGGFAYLDDAGILSHSILKGQRSAGLQQLAQRAHVQRGQRTVGRAGALAVFNACGDDLLQRVGAARQLVGRSAEGVGVDDAAARRSVLPVDALNERRVGDIQFLRACAQLEPGSLQHGAHAAVQQDGIALLEKFIHLHRSFPSFCIRSGCAAHNGHTRPVVLLPGGR